MLDAHLEALRVDDEARRPVAAQRLEVLVEAERVVDVRRARLGVARPPKTGAGDPAGPGARLVGPEAHDP
jgi:hypothetical protein